MADCDFTDLERRILGWANSSIRFGSYTNEAREAAEAMQARGLVTLLIDDRGILFTETPTGALAAHRAFMDPAAIANEHIRAERYKDEATF